MTLTGLYVPLITPFGHRGAVALDALEALAHQVLDAGATGLVALGTTGEPDTLTPAERRSWSRMLAGRPRRPNVSPRAPCGKRISGITTYS